MKRLIFIFSISLLSSCVHNETTGRTQFILVPDNQINAMGASAFAELQQEETVETDPRINAYVGCIAGAITAEVGGNWELRVFQSDKPNAFALPGGKIGVYTGMLAVAKTQDQLAAVIGHEVAHVLAKHSAERVSQQVSLGAGLEAVSAAMSDRQSHDKIMAALAVGTGLGVTLPHSRRHESEADRIGQELMAKAGFNPTEAVQLWQNMSAAGTGGGLNFLSTHPSHEQRINDLNAGSAKAGQLYTAAQQAGKRPNCTL